VISRNGITILLGAPGLTFTRGGTYAATSLPDTPPAVGDFNGDGQPDFAVSGPFDKQIPIILGKPHATLNAASAYELGAAVNSVAIADVTDWLAPHGALPAFSWAWARARTGYLPILRRS